jgi:phosphoglycerate dehydrogenase-like enzyme
MKHNWEGRLLRGRTLGVVGLGSIGGRVAEMGVAWGMRVCGCVEHPTAERTRSFAERGIELADLDDVVRRADLLSIHVPLKDSTRGLIGPRVLAEMKPGSYLMNLARGGIVDETALRDALIDRSRLHGAALDVHEREIDGVVSPLASLPNVVLTPHIGAMALDAQREIGRRVNEIVDGFADRRNGSRDVPVGGPR